MVKIFKFFIFSLSIDFFCDSYWANFLSISSIKDKNFCSVKRWDLFSLIFVDQKLRRLLNPLFCESPSNDFNINANVFKNVCVVNNVEIKKKKKKKKMRAKSEEYLKNKSKKMDEKYYKKVGEDFRNTIKKKLNQNQIKIVQNFKKINSQREKNNKK